MQTTRIRRFLTLATMSVALVGANACDNDEGPDHDEPEIDGIRLVIGGTTITSMAGQPPATVPSIPVGTHNVSVTALTASGGTINLDDDFELRIIHEGGVAVTYTRTGNFTGTLAAPTAGQSTVRVQIFHLVEGHEDYEVPALTINVTQ